MSSYRNTRLAPRHAERAQGIHPRRMGDDDLLPTTALMGELQSGWLSVRAWRSVLQHSMQSGDRACLAKRALCGHDCDSDRDAIKPGAPGQIQTRVGCGVALPKCKLTCATEHGQDNTCFRRRSGTPPVSTVLSMRTLSTQSGTLSASSVKPTVISILAPTASDGSLRWRSTPWHCAPSSTSTYRGNGDAPNPRTAPAIRR